MFDWFLRSSSGPSIQDVLTKLEAKRIEREIALQEAILDRKNAYELAVARDRLLYLMSAGVLTIFVAGFSAARQKNILHTVVIPPILGLLAYQGNYCFGKHLEFVQSSAQKIFVENEISLALRPISVEELDSRILDSRLV